MNSKVVGSMSEWSGMLMDLHRQIHDGSLKKEELLAFLERRNPFGDPPVVVTIVPPQLAVKRTFAEAMAEAYKRLDLEAEYAAFVKEFGDAQTPGKWTLTMMQASKLTVSNIIAALRVAGSKADTWYSYPDTVVSYNARNFQDGSYFVDLEPGEDPDPELAGKSQNDLKKSKNDKVSAGHITWLERWFMELVHLLMTGVNLDKNEIWTICAGSLDSGGSVPCVFFCHGSRRVYGSDCCSPRSRDAILCARSAVPRQPKRVGANS